ncbi:LexA repressor [Alloiococcus otitis]|uniref:HTH cro/C1-type domain-containing protein n=1 Tax=Alloiococcus otitis ATCC 51267 TaxID=883081 RepID=K9E8Y2_9LACT|nr:XRE family transcriptional regulator [Alloiococcus otitis]EKU93148.1 hypothetical protein HMPREF9698_01490 [Alloiococcus otitis ATCC 51267]SUU80669.1 LexA repressor [Alloiococcus otitis]SUU91702.1 LexA repressor [Alloiococcus otitis]
MNDVGGRIKELRTGRDFSQTELAHKMGYKNYTTITKWESNNSLPRGKELKMLAELFNVTTDYILGLSDEKYPVDDSISSIYSQLNPDRQKKAYRYTQDLLDEQNSLHEVQTIYVISKLSAGTGIIDLDPEDGEYMEVKGHVPKHDLAFEVAGDSMNPLFEDKEIVYIERTSDVRSGQIIAVQINEEAYIKKAYKEDDHLRLVSLNAKYEDIYADENDDIRVIGRVLL